MTTAIADGRYLFRESESRWWRATTIRNGYATGQWLASTVAADLLIGMWRGPLPADDTDWIRATGDHIGRLFDE